MKVYKEKQYLVFDYEDGRTVKYDFATQQSIGIKGKPVKGLNHQLSGMTINQLTDCCEDKNYAEFLKFVERCESKYIYNMGTLLKKVPKYSNYEQLFSAGIVNFGRGEKFKYTISDIPKSLVKLCRDKNITLTNNFVGFYKSNPDAYLLAYNLDYVSLRDEDIYEILSADEYQYSGHYTAYLNMLLTEYGYTAKPLFLYIDHLATYEALGNFKYVMKELVDYARMMKAISPKFDKYPRNFLTTHRIACRNYNRLRKQFNEEMFKNRINKDYECTFGDYTFIYPNSTQDIKDEAVMQNNCVASYIDDVIDGRCHILFLRKKDNPEKSLVTIEVKNNHIVQAKRRFNDPVTPEDQKVINKWNEKFSIIKKAA